MKKNKVFIDISFQRLPLANQIVSYNLKCDPLYLPYVEEMLDAIYQLKNNNVISLNKHKKYLKDVAGDRLYTHLAVWNPDITIIIKYK